jgi:H+/gluconate symporter-like permease
MKWLVQFGKFWYDFIIGDDWRLAVGVVVTITVVFEVAHHGGNWWWLLPIAVALLLGVSVTHEMRRRLR